MNDLLVEQESPEEQAYARVSARLTMAETTLQQAKEAFFRFRFENRIPTPAVIARAAELYGEVDRLEREFQALLPAFNQAKARFLGWE